MIDGHITDPMLTIVIVSWNTKNMLRECLYSLGNGGRSRDLEVIVVDNESSDGSRQMVRSEFPDAKLINSGANIGFSKANNLALKFYQAPYVLLLNPDTVVENNAHWKMLDYLSQNSDVGAVGPQMVYPNREIQPLGLQWFPSPLNEAISILFLTTFTTRFLKHFLPYIDPARSGYVKILGGGCLMVKREVIDAVGVLDERFFMYAEDRDYCRRIFEAGWKLYYLSECRIVHDHGSCTRNAKSSFQHLMKCESTYKLMKKYYGSSGAFLYRFTIMIGATCRLFLLLILSPAYFMIFKRFNDKTRIRKQVLLLKWSIRMARVSIKNKC